MKVYHYLAIRAVRAIRAIHAIRAVRAIREPMNTLTDTHATLDTHGNVQASAALIRLCSPLKLQRCTPVLEFHTSRGLILVSSPQVDAMSQNARKRMG